MKQYVDIDKIEKMAIAGDYLSKILKELQEMTKEGIRLLDIDAKAEKICYDLGVIPAFKGYQNFPKSVCIGVNDTVVHGIPNEYILKKGDIVSLDMGVKYKDVYSDCAVTVAIGKISENAKKLMDSTRRSVLNAIKEAKPGKRIGDIGYAIQNTVEKDGFSVVLELTGHGIGYKLHEEPFIPGYGNKGEGEKLYEGQTIAIESIINEGSADITFSKADGWTTKTKDGMLSALFEHTIVIGANPRVLTHW